MSQYIKPHTVEGWEHQSRLQVKRIIELEAQLGACEPYLKEGETPAERIERERRDTQSLMTLLARARAERDEIREYAGQQLDAINAAIGAINAGHYERAADILREARANEYSTHQPGSQADRPGSIRREMGAVAPAPECKGVIAARERLEPEGGGCADGTASDAAFPGARNGVTAGRDQQPDFAHETSHSPSMTTKEIRAWLAPATCEGREQIERLLAHCGELESRHQSCTKSETPLVDALDFGDQSRFPGPGYGDLWELARTLEREVAEHREARISAGEEVHRQIRANVALEAEVERLRHQVGTHTLFAWWDHFNGEFVTEPEDANRRENAGNKLTPLFTVDSRSVAGKKPPAHVCGLAGYNGMIDPPCPACEASRHAIGRES